MAPRNDNHRHCLMQVASLNKKYPEGRATWKSGAVTWTGEIKPAPTCGTYSVRITWRPERPRPAVHVLSPELETRPGKRLPHVFSDGSLCLHYREEWTPRLKIADSIIPWTSEWLFFYEVWLATGDWQGGGHEPGQAEPKMDVTR